MKGNGLYPLKFRSIFKKTPWGGNTLGLLFGKDMPPGGGIGEAWEVSDRSDDNSIIINGAFKDMPLHRLMDGPMANDLLGRGYKRADTAGNRFPLLVKFIDAKERLSLQVHPDDAYVMANEAPGESGKLEAWYVIHTEPGAWIIRGLRPGTTRESLEESVGNGTLEDSLNFLSVMPGDVIFIPPGILHAIGPGIVLLEIQQNSDITYRFYDWGRARQLHVEKALDVIEFSPSKEHSPDKIPPTMISPPPRKRELLLECEKFTLESLELNAECDVDGTGTFHVLTVIEGTGKILYGQSEELEAVAGETILIPAALSLRGYRLRPQGRWKIIKAAPPLQPVSGITQ